MQSQSSLPYAKQPLKKRHRCTVTLIVSLSTEPIKECPGECRFPIR